MMSREEASEVMREEARKLRGESSEASVLAQLIRAAEQAASPTKKAVKHDDGKLRYDLIPAEPFEEVVLVYTNGAMTYADRNWELGMSWGRVFGALMRHAWAFWRGERYDRECRNKECMQNGRRTRLPMAATFDRNLPCAKCGEKAKRQHHLAAVVWCALGLMEYETTHPEMDDRPRKVIA